MIEDDLRSHYRALQPGPEAEQRVLAAVTAAATGPRRRTVRTGLAVAGSVTAAGAVSFAVAVLPGDHTTSSGPAAASQPPASTTTASVSTPPPAPTLRPVTPQVVVQNLIKLVSAKGTASKPSGRALSNFAAGEIVFNDGHGAAEIDVALTWPGQGTGPKKEAVPGQDVCRGGATCTTVAGGWKVQTYQGLEYPYPHANNATEWGVRAYRASDRLEVDITEWNAPTEKDSPTSRPTPPFTLTELITMATSPTWSATASPSTIAAAAGIFTPDVLPTR
jgi:hypothetical protein